MSALPPVTLSRFFAEHGRDLPWRHPVADWDVPWGVMVSEFMLQQTPVARVLPIFISWMTTWPTPAALAAATPGDAVRAWGRLGYPRRALRLHAAATTIALDHGGVVPDRVEQLLALPGVGDYTARAIAAFAYRRRTPVVDTNVRRVLNRAVRGTTDAGPATAADRELMLTLLPRSGAADFSAAVMELGALVCTAAAPKCDRCPVRDGCAWLAAGRPASEVKRTAQAWHGTDRQVRGKLLALLRDADEPLARAALDLAWPKPEQRDRCLASLVADRLAEMLPDGRYALPG